MYKSKKKKKPIKNDFEQREPFGLKTLGRTKTAAPEKIYECLCSIFVSKNLVFLNF